MLGRITGSGSHSVGRAPGKPSAGRSFRVLGIFSAAVTILTACVASEIEGPVATTNPDPPGAQLRVVILAGLCTSTEKITASDHWLTDLKSSLVEDYGFRDLPTGDADDEVIEFGYSPAGWNSPYAEEATLLGVEKAAENLRELLEAYPGSRFAVIGHSLGGLVALDALAKFRETDAPLRDRTVTTVTVSTPVKGFERTSVFLGGPAVEVLACKTEFSSLGDAQVWKDLAAGSPVLERVRGDSWDDVTVMNFANTRDQLVPVERAFFPGKGISWCWAVGPNFSPSLNHAALLEDEESLSQLLSLAFATDPVNNTCELQ